MIGQREKIDIQTIRQDGTKHKKTIEHGNIKTEMVKERDSNLCSKCVVLHSKLLYLV